MFGQTATDFTTNDCSGTSHHLFAELDAGKVIVISFVDPCASCIAPTLSAFSNAATFSSSYPGRVLCYVSDDLGNSTCSTINTWTTTNGISRAATFATTAVIQTPYGTGGMPKIVVLGGPNHHVYYAQNGTINVSNFNTAITQALAATGINEVSSESINMTVFPNPANNLVAVNYNLSEQNKVSFDIFNLLGEKVQSFIGEEKAAGKNEQKFDISTLTNGLYFLKITSGKWSEVKKFTVAK